MVSFKQQRQEEEFDATSNEDHIELHIEHHNQPTLMEVYVDPITENKKLIIVAALPDGAKNGDLNLLGTGPGTNLARITYNWPDICFNIDDLFAKTIADGSLPSCHPKILALKKGLQNTRDAIGKAPVGITNLTLPISVLTSERTILRKGIKVKEDGTLHC